jgi:hypothetical protein
VELQSADGGKEETRLSRVDKREGQTMKGQLRWPFFIGKEGRTMQLDKFQQVAADCTIGAVILGNPHNGDFHLWPLGVDIPEDVERRFRIRGLTFLGVFGMLAGNHTSARVALVDPPPPEDMQLAICTEFDRLYMFAVDQLMGDSIPWLERLHNLPDTRTRGPFEA